MNTPNCEEYTLVPLPFLPPLPPQMSPHLVAHAVVQWNIVSWVFKCHKKTLNFILVLGEYLSLLGNWASRKRLVKHFYIWMLWQVVKPTEITNEALQLLKKLWVKTDNENQTAIKQFYQVSTLTALNIMWHYHFEQASVEPDPHQPTYQCATSSYILQAFQHVSQTRIIWVNKPYWRRWGIGFLQPRQE